MAKEKLDDQSWIDQRRKCVEELTNSKPIWSDKPIGLAFSGGGIRSATISLGITQALARRGRLYAFDYLSTVSGGGYFGVFLRSLFLPQTMRGGNAARALDGSKDQTFRVANQILMDPPQARDYILPDGQTAKHPIRWLRENGRYLAPSGSSDLFLGISYIVRNWLAMMYVFILAMLAIFCAVQLALIGAAQLGNHLSIGAGVIVPFAHPFIWQGWTLSPLFLPAGLSGFVVIGAGAAYWLTEGMNYNPGSEDSSWRRFVAVLVITMLAGLLGVVLIKGGWLPVDDRQIRLLQIGLAVLVIALLTALLTAVRFLLLTIWTSTNAPVDAANPTPSMRRWLTKTQAFINQMALVFLAFALIDTLAIGLRQGRFGFDLAENPFGLLGVIFYPAAAYFIKKLPDWAGGLKGGLLDKLTSNVDAVALLIGLLLFGSLAVFADALVHMALWEGAAWASAAFATGWWAFVVVILVLGLMIGTSQDFINLSSLHPLYASRLTRAYIGASNDDRLKAGTGLSDGHPKDHIDPQIYHETVLPIGWHLVNLTLNVTLGSQEGRAQTSSIVQRDRKGQRFIVGPGGIAVDSNVPSYDWNSNAEKLSVGQQCAISGAAASSGMGRRTSFGKALALTYANVRLGYWWSSGQGSFAQKTLNRFFGSYRYLLDEMTARYSKNEPRFYLTDGGHSENSGALALLEHGCGFILVADNGQDPGFTFSDLEIFIRTARTDLGWDMKVATKEETVEAYDDTSLPAFFNASADWRKAARADDGTGCALFLLANKIDGDMSQLVRIIWLKPRIFDGLPADIATYAEENKPFPHQTTVDQFFDEAQWESYRRLGYEMIRKIFNDKMGIDDVPIIKIPPLNSPPVVT